MTWFYSQKSGLLKHGPNHYESCGYSGAGVCKNGPEFQDLHNLGPIPRGKYTIGEPYDTEKHGPFVLPLTPHPENEMFGRFGFLIHGDSVHSPGTASEGCIILPRVARNRIAESDDHDLEVTL